MKKEAFPGVVRSGVSRHHGEGRARGGPASSAWRRLEEEAAWIERYRPSLDARFNELDADIRGTETEAKSMETQEERGEPTPI